jgi:hypothetical protein
VADDLVWSWTDEPPLGLGRRNESRDDVVVATKMLRRRDHVILSEDRVRQGHRIPRMDFAVDEVKNLAASLVHADDPRRLESFTFEKSQERMNRWRPRTGATTNGIPAADRVIKPPAQRLLFRHRGGD